MPRILCVVRCFDVVSSAGSRWPLAIAAVNRIESGNETVTQSPAVKQRLLIKRRPSFLVGNRFHLRWSTSKDRKAQKRGRTETTRRTIAEISHSFKMDAGSLEVDTFHGEAAIRAGPQVVETATSGLTTSDLLASRQWPPSNRPSSRRITLPIEIVARWHVQYLMSRAKRLALTLRRAECAVERAGEEREVCVSFRHFRAPLNATNTVFASPPSFSLVRFNIRRRGFLARGGSCLTGDDGRGGRCGKNQSYLPPFSSTAHSFRRTMHRRAGSARRKTLALFCCATQKVRSPFLWISAPRDTRSGDGRLEVAVK